MKELAARLRQHADADDGGLLVDDLHEAADALEAAQGDIMDKEYVERAFAWDYAPPDLQEVSRLFFDLARQIVVLPKNPERTLALRRLLEAKDAAVRAAVIGPMEAAK